MYCIKCGTDVGNARFCPECGNEMPNQDFGFNYTPIQPTEIETFTVLSAYKSMFKKYAKFEGRSSRSEYWLAAVMNTIIMLGGYLLVMFPFIYDMNMLGEPRPFSAGLFLFGSLALFIYSLVVLVPSLAMSVRRLHDTGKSGWFLLLSLLPYVGSLIIFVFSVMDSQPGPNQYGPNPKGE